MDYHYSKEKDGINEQEEPSVTRQNDSSENANIEKSDSQLLSFHEAVRWNDLQRVVQLLEFGVDCNLQDPSTGNTALIEATGRRHVNIVKALLSANADVNLSNNEGTTPLHLCSKRKTFHPDIALRLSRCENANFSIQERLSGNSPLHILVETAMSKNKHKEKIVEILKEMVPRCSNPNAKNKEGNTAMHIMCSGKKDNDEIAGIILASSDLSIRNRLGETPLITAIKNEKYTLAACIMDRSTNVVVDLRDRCGYTPLHHACMKDAPPQIVNHLLEMGSDINGKDFNGDTPLHLAAQTGRARIVGELLKWDWDLRINMQNDAGYTPLMCAVYGGFAEIVRLLIKWRCDVTVISYQTNTTAFDIAKTTKSNGSNHCEVYNVLTKYMVYTLGLTPLSTDSF